MKRKNKRKKVKKKQIVKGNCSYCKMWTSAKRRKKMGDGTTQMRYCIVVDDWVTARKSCENFTLTDFVFCPLIQGRRHHYVCLKLANNKDCKKCQTGKIVRFYRPLKRFARKKGV